MIKIITYTITILLMVLQVNGSCYAGSNEIDSQCGTYRNQVMKLILQYAESAKSKAEQFSKLQDTIKEQEATILNLNEIIKYKDSVLKLQNELSDSYKSNNQNQQKLILQYENQITKRQVELNLKGNEINDLRSELKGIDNEINNLKSELNGKYTDIDKLQSELKGKDNEINDLKSELKGKDNEIDNLQSELKGKYTDIDKLQSELKGKDNEINDLKSELKGKDDEISDLLSKVKEKDSELAVKTKKLEDKITACQEKSSCFGKSTELHTIEVPTLFPVSCDSDLAGSGWIVIQRRMDGSVNFNRTWSEYKNGFGNLRGEFFIGLQNLHLLTQSQPHELYISLMDFENETRFARYSKFAIGCEQEFYELKTLGEYSGDAGDSMEGHKNVKFSTPDMNHDTQANSCAKSFSSGWWFNNCYHCNLNGLYTDTDATYSVIEWRGWKKDRPLKFTQMMIRPKSL